MVIFLLMKRVKQSRLTPLLAVACTISLFVIIFTMVVKHRRASISTTGVAEPTPVMSARPSIDTSLPVCNNTYLFEIPRLLTPEQCDQLRAAAVKHGMEDSRVGEAENELDKNVRKSTQTWVKYDHNEITKIIAAKAMDMAKSLRHCFGDITIAKNFEDIQIVRYDKDGKYDPHYDGTECKGDKESPCLKNQRIATLLVYLNDDFAGGETRFPNLKVSIKPKKGNAIFFLVSDPKTGMVYKNTLHGGDPVLDGEKWIATQWIRRSEE